MTDASKSNLQELHASWDAANQRVRSHERLLAAALALFEAGKGEVPVQMIEEVQAMRTDCNAKFKALMAAVGRQR